MRSPPAGLRPEDVAAVLAEARADFEERRVETERALAELPSGAIAEEQAVPLRRFFHSIAGLMPSLGYREIGFLARHSEELTALLPGQPALLRLLRANYDEVVALMREALDGTAPSDRLLPAPPPRDAAALAETVAPLADAAATILIVDDDPATLHLSRITLARLGYRVVTCDKPTEVLHALERERPDLIVLDIMMPLVDGFTVCKQVREVTTHRYTPILFLSSMTGLEERVRGLTLGADDYITKPFQPAELAARVRAHLQRVATLREMSVRDALTRAYNRGFFDERLRQEVKRCQRTGGAFSLAMLDIDFFKRINDTHGHQAGDAVLVHTAQVLGGQIRGSDVLSRYGGEEFALILIDADLQPAGRAVARNLMRFASTPALLSLPDRPLFEVSLTLSAGVACYRRGDAPETLLARSDRALYAAKTAGRNCVQIEAQDQA
jgi:diguanylate cyclase (GGDEF)-like protein